MFFLHLKRTFNDEYHDFMGTEMRQPKNTELGMCGQNYHQHYYRHPCLETMGGDPDWSPYTTLDYLTFELFDDNGDVYYIFFSSAFQSKRL